MAMGRSKAGFCRDGRVEQGKVGTLRTARSATMPCLETQHRAHSHGSIPASGAFGHRSFRPASSGRRGGRPGARTEAEELRSEPRPEAPEEKSSCGCVRPRTSSLAMSWAPSSRTDLDDGASRIERDGQSWFRGRGDAEDDHDLAGGPVTYRRARYRSGASGASPVPVDESLGSSTIT